MTVNDLNTELLSTLVSKGDLVTPMSIRAAVRTGIIDAVGNSASSAIEIARQIDGNVRAVTTVLDHLVAEGVFAKSDGNDYSLTEMGKFLSENNAELGIRALFDGRTLVGKNELALSDLHHTLLTGRPATEAHSGQTLWEEIDNANQSVSEFDWETPGFAAEIVLEDSLWRNVDSVIDLGGNTGSLAIALLNKYPHLSASVLDFKTFTAEAEKRVVNTAIEHRLKGIEGSFFDDLPLGHDVYLLSAILADWEDDACVQILETVRRAAHACGGLLVVAEVHLSSSGELAPATSTDVRLQASVTRPDRTAAEVIALIESSGFEIVRSDTSQPDRSLVIARTAK